MTEHLTQRDVERLLADPSPQTRAEMAAKVAASLESVRLTEGERKLAEGSRDALLSSGKFKVIHTEIIAATTFYPAEEYHQDYYKKNPIRYAYYRKGCGRDARVQQLWGSN